MRLQSFPSFLPGHCLPLTMNTTRSNHKSQKMADQLPEPPPVDLSSLTVDYVSASQQLLVEADLSDSDGSVDVVDEDGDYGDDDRSINTRDTNLSDTSDPPPPHACRYCGIKNPLSCVQCLDDNKWFCSDTAGTGSSSHIVSHLVTTKSTRISLHPDSPLGDSPISCYNCGTKNIFTLGFCAATQSQAVVLLCRTCVELKEMKELEWSTQDWKPLVQHRKLMDWLVQPPEEEEQVLARHQVNKADIMR